MDRPYNIKVSGQNGQTLVEFALIVGLILALLFGIMEFARAWQYTNALTNGAREGALFAARSKPVDVNEVKGYTFSVITSAIPYSPSLETNFGVYTGTSTTPLTGSKNVIPRTLVRVKVGYDFDILTGSIIPFFSGKRTLVREATMSHE
jgi:TadE-like protein